MQIDTNIIENFKDPLWRLENLYKIKTKKGTIENLIPNEAQSQFLSQEKQNNIILKARQLGFSTLCLIRLLDKALFTPNTTCVIMAHKKDSVQKLFRIIQFAYENYPSDFPKAKAKYNTKSELEFNEINSRIYVSTEVRGDTVDWLHMSEMAFMDTPEEKFIATASAVTPTGGITIESTANGVGDFFYDLYNTAEERGFKAHFFPWYRAKEYWREFVGVEFTREDRKFQERYDLKDGQLAWKKFQEGLIGDKFKQEYPSNPQEAFIAAGGNVFPIELLDDLTFKEPKIVSNGMFVWANPDWGHKYSMGVDVAEGIGKDESSIDIIDLNTGEQVWHWSGNCQIPMLAEKIEIYAKKYHNAYLIPEANNHGYSLIYMLQGKGLNIYKREKFDGPTVKQVDRLGWQTTRRTKPLMVQQLSTALHEKDIKINHKKSVAQMKTFVNNPENGKMEAAYGKKDDCVISLCLAWQGIRKQAGPERKSFNSFDFTKKSNITGY